MGAGELPERDWEPNFGLGDVLAVVQAVVQACIQAGVQAGGANSTDFRLPPKWRLRKRTVGRSP
jgi:hypothetical protein